jgi:hypothetical protein
MDASEPQVHIAVIKYVDLKNSGTSVLLSSNNTLNYFDPYLLKRQGLEHEAELKTIIVETPRAATGESDTGPITVHLQQADLMPVEGF